MNSIPFFYFIRVLATVFSGFFLAHKIIANKLPTMEGLYLVLNRSTTSRLVLAFVTLLVGLLSLVIGKVYLDFFPSILGIITAIIIFTQEYTNSNDSKNKLISILSKYGVNYKDQWGIITMAFGLLHIFTVNIAWL